jgi:hypothetical protein
VFDYFCCLCCLCDFFPFKEQQNIKHKEKKTEKKEKKKKKNSRKQEQKRILTTALDWLESDEDLETRLTKKQTNEDKAQVLLCPDCNIPHTKI